MLSRVVRKRNFFAFIAVFMFLQLLGVKTDVEQASLSQTSIASLGLVSQLSFLSTAQARSRSWRSRRFMRRRRFQRMRRQSWRRRHQMRRRQQQTRQKPAARQRTAPRKQAAQSSSRSSSSKSPAGKSSTPKQTRPEKTNTSDGSSVAKKSGEKTAEGGGRTTASAPVQDMQRRAKKRKKKAETLSDVLKRPSGTMIGFAKRIMKSVNSKAIQSRKNKRAIARERRRRRKQRIASLPTRVSATQSNKAVKSRASVGVPPVVKPSTASTPPTLKAVQPKPVVQRQKRRVRRRRPLPRLPWSTNGPALKRTAVAGELLVANITPNLVRQADALGIAVDKSKVSLGADTTLTRITFSKSRSSNTVIGLVSQFISGENVYPNHRYHHYDPANGQARGGWRTSIPNKGSQDCATSECYGAQAIRWNDNLTRCAVGRRIGVIDSAIDRDHATFNGQRIQTKRLHASPSSRGAARHGTGVLAILAGSRNSKTPGLVPDANFFHVDAFFRSKNGALTSDTLSLVKALGILRKWRAEIVNLSLVGPKDQLVEHALRQLSDQGAVLVSAAGNGGPAGGTSYPAGYENVIAVTAIDKHSKAYAYANRGAFVDVAAPGVDIWTALPGQRQGLQSGTSFAVPFATAVVAAMYIGFLRSDRLAVLRQLPTSDLGRNGKDPIYGAGLIQAPTVCREQPVVAASAGQSDRYAALGAGSVSTATSAASAGVETAGWRKTAFTQHDER